MMTLGRINVYMNSTEFSKSFIKQNTRENMSEVILVLSGFVSFVSFYFVTFVFYG